MTRTIPLARSFLSTTVLPGILFLCSGRMNDLMLNAYLAIFPSTRLLVVLVADRTLDGESRNSGPGANESGSRIGASFLSFATVIPAALDTGRRHWTQASDTVSQLTALAVLLQAAGLEIRTMAMVLSMPGVPIVLGSTLTPIPAVCCSLLVLPRVAREDEFLRENLPSHLQYAGVVLCRLIPCFW
jgi:hypothetical protein